jgi:hypothetical protein
MISRSFAFACLWQEGVFDDSGEFGSVFELIPHLGDGWRKRAVSDRADVIPVAT